MSNCPNCNKKLTCGCQKRVSKKGVAGCTTCLASLNANALVKPTQPVPSNNAPLNLSATYSGPGEQISKIKL